MATFIAFDTETTGINAKRDAIIEIGAAKFEGGKLTDTWGTFVNPMRDIPEDATRVHGITNDMVADAPPFLDSLEEFAEFCGDSILVAHNAMFDYKFLTAAMTDLRSQSPRGVILDTFKIAKVVKSELFNHRLESLVKHYKVPSRAFHRATDDSIYCGHVFLGLGKDLAAVSGGKVPLQKLIELSGGELRFPEVAAQGHQMALL